MRNIGKIVMSLMQKDYLKTISNMTIEERAKEYSLKDFDGYYTGREKAVEEGYIAGAKEQQVIDDAALQERFEKILNGQKWDLIDRACEWLEEHLYEEMFDLPFNNWIELFKKAMEE